MTHGGVTTEAGQVGISAGPGVAPLVRACRELAALEFTQRPLVAVTRKMAELVHELLPAAVCVSTTVVDDRPRCTVAFSGPLAAILDERQYAPDYGPGIASSLTGRTIEVPDLRAGSQFTDFSRQAAGRASGARSRWRCPAREASAPQLRRAMDSRATIGQAKGMVMERHGCAADEAFDELRDASTRSNRKVRDVARSVVDGRRLEGPRGDPPMSRAKRRRDAPRGRGGNAVRRP